MLVYSLETSSENFTNIILFWLSHTDTNMCKRLQFQHHFESHRSEKSERKKEKKKRNLQFQYHRFKRKTKNKTENLTV